MRDFSSYQFFILERVSQKCDEINSIESTLFRLRRFMNLIETPIQSQKISVNNAIDSNLLANTIFYEVILGIAYRYHQVNVSI
jgi:hypothetical protein